MLEKFGRVIIGLTLGCIGVVFCVDVSNVVYNFWYRINYLIRF